jgi:hypothetical protein
LQEARTRIKELMISQIGRRRRKKELALVEERQIH